MFKRIALFLSVAATAISCRYDKYILPVASHEYFPLHIGDSWEYVTAYSPNDIITTRSIVAQAPIDGYQYFVMVQTALGYTDTTYYRVDGSGYLYSRKSGATVDNNLYRLSASVGDKWETTFYDNGHGFTTLTSLGDTHLNNVTLRNCKSYYFDIPEWADEETVTTLAPGLGMVRQGGSWGITMNLKHAVIDGKPYDF